MKTGNFSGTVDKDMTVHANGSTYKLIIRAQIPDIIRMEPRKLEWTKGAPFHPQDHPHHHLQGTARQPDNG